MATVKDSAPRFDPIHGYMDEEGFPWLENGSRMTQPEFHERYKKLPTGLKAELIGGIVYLMPSPLKIRHGRVEARLIGWLYLYSSATPGTEVQNNTTTILGEASEPQPDSALLILPSHGGQTVDGQDDYTYGAPELIIEVANTSQSMDLGAKLRDYECAGVREYIVWSLQGREIRWFALRDGQFEAMEPGADGIFRSQAFPGLWLDVAGLMTNDKRAINATLARGLATPEHGDLVTDLERRRVQKSTELG